MQAYLGALSSSNKRHPLFLGMGEGCTFTRKMYAIFMKRDLWSTSRPKRGGQRTLASVDSHLPSGQSGPYVKVATAYQRVSRRCRPSVESIS